MVLCGNVVNLLFARDGGFVLSILIYVCAGIYMVTWAWCMQWLNLPVGIYEHPAGFQQNELSLMTSPFRSTEAPLTVG